MKKTITLIACFILTITIHAQQITLHNPAIVPVILERISPALMDLPEYPPTEAELNGPHVIRENPSLEDRVEGIENPNALPKGPDPALQTDYSDLRGTTATVLSNWSGLSAAVDPSDNTIAVGPNHVFQMTNNSTSTFMKVWNKSGTVLVNNKKVSDITGVTNDCGDPNCIYDQVADQYVMLVLNSCSFSNKKIIICVTKNHDPTGAWYVYTVKLANGFPDYPKLALWGDTYFVTTNSSKPTVWALNRSQLLSGAILSSAQEFDMSAFGTIGFQAPSPVMQTGAIAPPAGEEERIIRVADDGWNGVSSDHLELFKMHIDWTNSANSKMTGPTNLTISAFDSKLCSYTSGSCIPQSGSSTKLDPLSNIVMDKVQYRNFSDHESIVLSHTCDADGSDHAGVRWYELRMNTSSAWYIYQQSTYFPNTTGRWMSTVTINGDGSIALGYNTSSSSTDPSQAFTGRASADALNTMTVTENTPKAGTHSNGSSRYGDYNGIVTDPSDNSFWLTCNYNTSSSWSTNVCHFSITHTFGKSAPANVMVNDITMNSVELSWTGSQTPLYDIRYRKAGTEEWITAGNTSLADYVVTGLNPDTKYEFSLGGEADADILYSDVVSATTLKQNAGQTVTEASSQISIAPVPASTNVKISFEVPNATDAKIEIYSLNGQLVLTQLLYADEGINITNTDVHTLQNGSYVVKVITDGRVSTRKMVIEK